MTSSNTYSKNHFYFTSSKGTKVKIKSAKRPNKDLILNNQTDSTTIFYNNVYNKLKSLESKK